MSSKAYTVYHDGTRELKELYQIVLDNFANGFSICENIRFLFHNYTISNEEKEWLINNFHSNKPEWYNSKFWWNTEYIGRVFWWRDTREGNEQRKLFLQYLINKYS